MSLTAYIRYDQNNRIVPGGPIVSKTKPAVGNWQVVTEGSSVTLSGQLRAYVKVNRFGKPIASSLFLGKTKPATGRWIEVNATFEGSATPSTTTTTTTSAPGTTTTTTTQIPITTTTTTTSAIHAINVYVQGGSSNSNLCPQGSTGSGTQVIYANTPVLQTGTIAYYDAGGNQPMIPGGFWYKQIGYDTVWSVMYNNGVLYEGCVNSGTLTGKATNNSSTPCNGAGIDITFTVSDGLPLGYSSSAVIAAGGFDFIAAGFTEQQTIRILQTGTNVWFNYKVINGVVAVPIDNTAYTPFYC